MQLNSINYRPQSFTSMGSLQKAANGVVSGTTKKLDEFMMSGVDKALDESKDYFTLVNGKVIRCLTDALEAFGVKFDDVKL